MSNNHKHLSRPLHQLKYPPPPPPVNYREDTHTAPQRQGIGFTGYCLNNPTDEATCTCIYTKNLYIHIGMAINESNIQYTCAILGVFSFVHT